MSIPFHARLKATRELRGLSQGELSEKTGLNPTAVSHFETGKRKPSFDNLRTLADALRVSVDYLMGRTEHLQGEQLGDAKLFRHVEHLTEDDLQIAEDFMASLARRRQSSDPS